MEYTVKFIAVLSLIRAVNGFENKEQTTSRMMSSLSSGIITNDTVTQTPAGPPTESITISSNSQSYIPASPPQTIGTSKSGSTQSNSLTPATLDKDPAENGPPGDGPPEIGPTVKGPPEIGHTVIGPSEVGPPDIGTTVIGPPEIGPPEIGPSEVIPTVIGPPGISPSEKDDTFVGPPGFVPTEKGDTYFGPPGFGPTEIGPTVRSPPEIGPTASGPSGSSTTSRNYWGEGCDYTTCVSSLLRNGNFSSSCCLQCSCDDFCEYIGNCCHNMDYQSFKTSNGETCLLTHFGADSNRDNLKFSGKLVSYLLVDTCGSYERNDKCSSPYETDLDSYTPVLSSVTWLSYKNKFCAECSGETESDIVDWRLILSCSQTDGIHLYTSHISIPDFMMQTKLLDHCWLHWIPPSVQLVSDGMCARSNELYAHCQDHTSVEQGGRLCYDSDQHMPYVNLGEFGDKSSKCQVCNDSLLKLYNNTCHLETHLRISVQNIFSTIVDTEVLERYLGFQHNISTTNVKENGDNECMSDFEYNPILVGSHSLVCSDLCNRVYLSLSSRLRDLRERAKREPAWSLNGEDSEQIYSK